MYNPSQRRYQEGEYRGVIVEHDTEALAPSWTPRTLRDAYRDRPPTEYIVAGTFATESLTVVYGAPGTMKSMLMADMICHVAGGIPWLPGFDAGVEVLESPVLWLDFDNGTRRTDGRFDAIGRALGLLEDAPVNYLSMPTPSLNANDVDALQILVDTVRDTAARLVVVDNLGLITGEVEENSASMATIMGNLRHVAELTKAGIVLIHHQRKGGAGAGRPGDALRGHSSIEAAVDLALHITREPNSNRISIRSTKTRDVEVKPMAATFEYEHKGDTTDLARAYFVSERTSTSEDAITSTILDVVGRFAPERGVGKTKLIELVKDDLKPEPVGVNKIRGYIDDMLATTGDLTETKAGTHRVIKLG